MEKITLNSSLKRNPKQIFSKIDEEIIMLNLQEGKYFALNKVGAKIWEFVEQPISVQSLVLKLREEFDVPKNICEIETLDLLNQLYENGLIIDC